MAAVLARKIVADLLKRYANCPQQRLTVQIDTFLGQPGHPSVVTKGMHHVREAADMSAHTQEEQGAETQEYEDFIIEISREEAEWTLDFVVRLFDYFVVQPHEDETIMEGIEDKSRRAGRRPLSGDGEAT